MLFMDMKENCVFYEMAKKYNATRLDRSVNRKRMFIKRRAVL